MGTIVLTSPVCAGIAGFRSCWDRPLELTPTGHTSDFVHETKSYPVADWAKTPADRPGRLGFDAIHRQLLVRFPGLFEQVAQAYARGEVIDKAELVLAHAGTELAPPGDTNFPTPSGYWWRSNWGVLGDWTRRPARWHAKVEALHRPWETPTYNAFRPGCYWDASGGYSNTDRYGTALNYDPPELSSASPEGKSVVTRVFTDATFGATLSERLANFEACGLAVSKVEKYDHHYYRDEYEWGTATGGRAVLVGRPVLVVTTKPGPVEELRPYRVPVPTSYGSPKAFLAARESVGSSGRVTSPVLQRLASLEDFDQPPFDGSPKPPRPLWWALWLDKNYGKERLGQPFRDEPRKRWVRSTTDYDAYVGWVDQILSTPYRGWHGFQAAKNFLQYFSAPLTPEPCRRHLAEAWNQWLRPDKPTSFFEHPAASRLAGLDTTAPDFIDPYVARTDDWQGNKSFFRGAFVTTESTQNINISAVTGCLLGGRILGQRNPLEEGRRGLAGLAYLWFWKNGTTQENHDHYYLGQTLVGLKALADYGPAHADRLLARCYLTKVTADMADARHPNLHRFTSTSNRTSLEYVFHTQDGPDFVCHAVTGDHLHDVG